MFLPVPIPPPQHHLEYVVIHKPMNVFLADTTARDGLLRRRLLRFGLPSRASPFTDDGDVLRAAVSSSSDSPC